MIAGTDLTDARKCLKVVKSPRIRGLGYPGASGLLALIFKEWFGTVERPCAELSWCLKSTTIRDIAAWLKRKEEWKERDAVFLIVHYEKESSPTERVVRYQRVAPPQNRHDSLDVPKQRTLHHSPANAGPARPDSV